MLQLNNKMILGLTIAMMVVLSCGNTNTCVSTIYDYAKLERLVSNYDAAIDSGLYKKTKPME